MIGQTQPVLQKISLVFPIRTPRMTITVPFPNESSPVILPARVPGCLGSHPSLILLSALRNHVAPLVKRGRAQSREAATLLPDLLRAAFAPPTPIGPEEFVSNSLDVAAMDNYEMNWEGGT